MGILARTVRSIAWYAAAAACAAQATGELDVAAVEREVEQIRGLSFRLPVDYRTIEPEAVGPYLEAKLDDQIGRGSIDRYGRSLEFLGLLPAGTDLRASYVAMMQEQISELRDWASAKGYF